MPQFDLGPNNPAGIIADPSTGQVLGDVRVVNGQLSGVQLVPPRPTGDGGGGGGGRGGSGGGRGAPAGETAAQRRRRLRRERAERRRAAAAARRAEAERRKNPLYRPFMTPAQLRAEAERLAQLSVADESSLREEQRKEEEALGAISGTAANVLGGYQQQVIGGLQGLGQLYSSLAGSAQTAGQEAVAAAGAAPTLAPTGTATVPAEFANVVAGTSGYVPAAVTTGQRLIGASRQSLSRALADRANTVSANMARFLQDLQQQEYERALAQEIQSQNVARLGLQEQELAADIATDQANLALRTESVAQGWARIQQSAANAALRAQERAENANQDKKEQRRKSISAAKNSLLKDRSKLTSGSKRGTGTYKFEVEFYNPQSQRVEKITVPSALNENDAIAKAANRIPNNVDRNSLTPIRGAENTEMRPATSADLIRFAVPILREAGMTRNAAIKWVNRFLVPYLSASGSTSNTSGAFMGGVGGSNL